MGGPELIIFPQHGEAFVQNSLSNPELNVIYVLRIIMFLVIVVDVRIVVNVALVDIYTQNI